ncbi:MAG TPA: two-component system response regulator CreB [Methylotenera sp.]|nr:two-component system response regulator CreB [Methylotenera sp.]
MKPRILLVEDEMAIADNVQLALQRAGFDCHHEIYLTGARNHIQAHEYALMILDVGLPDGNGFDFCKEVRTYSEIPVIFLTARADEVDRVVGLEIGADDYVLKPFSPRELAARVSAILRRRGPPTIQASAPQLNSTQLFNVDNALCRIYYQQTPLPLTRAEFMVLSKLISQPNRVFSRADLMQVAGLANASLDRAMDTHIKGLRAKLVQAGCAQELIVTHRGLGYSFNLTVKRS